MVQVATWKKAVDGHERDGFAAPWRMPRRPRSRKGEPMVVFVDSVPKIRRPNQIPAAKNSTRGYLSLRQR